MTRIYCVGSASSGNSYIFESDGNILIVELGCTFDDICVPFHHKYSIVNGSIVTHTHSDHLNEKTVKMMRRRGMSVYMAENVLKENPQTGINLLLSHVPNHIGRFIVQTFPAPHNVPNSGFLITTPTKERIIFLTDTTGVSIKFKNIDCIMIECNHDEETILENMMEHTEYYSHPEYHLSLEGSIDFCRANIAFNTSRILFLHPSLGNINTERALQKAKQELNFENISFAQAGNVYTVESTNF